MGTVDYDKTDPNHAEGENAKQWIPYEQDMSHYPEVFRKYQENYARYDEIKQRFENEPQFKEQSESAFTRKLPKDMTPWESKYDPLMPKFTGTLCQ